MGFQVIRPKGRMLALRYLLPKADREAAGVREVWRSLETHDLARAKRRAPALAVAMQAEVESRKARHAPGLIGAAHAAAARGEDDPAFMVTVEDHLQRLRKLRGFDPETGNPHTTPAETAELRAAHAIAAGKQPDTLRGTLGRYMREKAPKVRPGTLYKERRRLEDFMQWAGAHLDMRAVDRKQAGQYVSARVVASGLAAKSQRQWIGALGTFWTWAIVAGLATENPWTKQTARVTPTGRGRAAGKRAWSADELARLLCELPDRLHLREAVALAAFTGCRIEELARLRTEHVIEVEGITCLSIVQAKTEAGVRMLPVHSAIASLVARLAAASSDGFLLAGLKEGGKDAARSHYLSKRFGYYRARLGLTSGDFHSLRRAFITALEAAGVPESTAKLLSGHARQSLTFGLYSRGVPAAALHEAIERVSYGPAVTAAVAAV